ncbi:hypothetical protein QJS04_geneDACA013247 [Acorus gramineus]|uniref:Uncharacterized protein n=1 Tax=Acorus gramineus TaxID=55184 RepID=A0AAV9BCK0_ACOGR|nr:hypothetical protein QJS04_geneDACA013247 [Acorus gramineus]
MVISSDSTLFEQLSFEERMPSLVEDRLLDRAGGVPRQLRPPLAHPGSRPDPD